MSLYGSAISVVSVGCSCQSANQIEQNHSFIEQTLASGHGLRKRGGYFDYLVTPIETVIRFVEDGIPELPGAHSVEGDEGFWSDEGLWFYHYFRPNNDAQNSLEKIAHLRNSFMSLDKPVLFVLSNTQNNLKNHCKTKSFAEQFAFTTDRLARLRDALAGRFGKNFAGLMVVENLKTTVGAKQLEMVSRLIVDIDDSVWQGSVEEWRFCFRNALSYHLPGPMAPIPRETSAIPAVA